jgi:hypothetical protein
MTDGRRFITPILSARFAELLYRSAGWHWVARLRIWVAPLVLALAGLFPLGLQQRLKHLAAGVRR